MPTKWGTLSLQQDSKMHALRPGASASSRLGEYSRPEADYLWNPDPCVVLYHALMLRGPM